MSIKITYAYQEGVTMSFLTLATARQSCRNFDATRPVEEEKLTAVLRAAQLAPSACNGQPYHLTVCRGETAAEVAKATQGMGMNKFASEAPVQIVISEKPYVKTAAVGAKLKNNDYRSIDIGIVAAYLTAQAASDGLESCILGWFDNAKLRQILTLDGDARLVISLGYAKVGDVRRDKKRKSMEELVNYR